MNIKQGIDLNRSEIVIYNTYTFIISLNFKLKRFFRLIIFLKSGEQIKVQNPELKFKLK